MLVDILRKSQEYRTQIAIKDVLNFFFPGWEK
jgi:hypothetical protein